MTMQRPVSQGVSNNEGVSGRVPSSAMTAAATTAIGLLSNNNRNSTDPQHPPTTSLSRSGSLGRDYPSATPSSRLWGQSSNIPLLSPSELTGASEGKRGDNGTGNDQLQSLLLAQVRQRLQEQDQQNDSFSQAKKRQRTSTESSDVSDLLSRGSSSTLTAGELGLAAGGLAPSLLRSCSSMTIPGGPASLSNFLSPTAPDLNSALSASGGVAAGANSNVSQIQQLLRQQQLHELQQLQQLKKREDMKRLTQLQSRDAVLQLMLQQQHQQQQQQQQHQQQQQQQQQQASVDTGNASLAAQLKAFQDQQDSQANNGITAKIRASAIDEAAVAKYMRSNSQNNAGITAGGSQQLNLLQALANRGQLDEMPPPPPMVSAVSSLDSVAIMSMLLPSNQQNQNHQQQQASASNRLLGTELALGPTASGLGAGANLSASMLSPMPFPSPGLGNLGNIGNLGNLGNLGMGGAASYYGAGLNSGLSSWIGRPGASLLCPPAGGPGGSLALHPSSADVIYEQRRLAAAAEVSNTVRDSSVGKPPDAFVDRDPDGRAHDLPTLLVVPMDHMQLSSHQTLLRYQIEVFRAGEEDTSTHTRGRNKPVQLGQIGIRCRHCKVLPVSRRKRGSVYFPRAVEGFYQAAQNMNSTHLQTGECPLMGNALRQEFANLIATRGVSTGAGRAYWAKQARKLGLRNTENGIVFDKKEPGGGNRTTENASTSKESGKAPKKATSTN